MMDAEYVGLPERIPGYEVVSKIAEGGMGEVYLGRHTKLERSVAIKVLQKQLFSKIEIRNRFLKEANILSKLIHPNIVSVFDFIESGEQFYMIMEYVEGTAMDQLIKDGKQNLSNCRNIFAQILSAVSYAHGMNVIHRDIKPSNIIISNNANVKILDFGIAKIIDDDKTRTRTGTRIGSIAYMSPEQILGKDVDKRTDIYSTGITLYEFLSGKNPYESCTSDYQIQTMIINDEIDLSQIPEEYISVIARATAKNPYSRYSDCDDFLKALSGEKDIRQEVLSTPIATMSNNKTMMIQMPGAPVGGKSEKKFIVPIFLGIAFLITVFSFYFFLYDNDSPDPNMNVKNDKIVEGQETKEDEKEKSKNVDLQSKNSDSEEDNIRMVVNNLLKAWQGKNITGFFSNLTLDYRYESKDGVKRDYTQRLNKAYEIFANNNFINITTWDMNANIYGDLAEVKYRQKYNSNTVNETTTKKLFLRKQKDGWKIYKELSGFD